MKRFVIVLSGLLLIANPAIANSPPEVANVSAFQRAHTAIVDLTYDIVDMDGDTVHVSIWYSLDGGTTWDRECLTISGDVGPGVVPATGLTASWDAGVDFPDFINHQFSLRVYADDGGFEDNFILIEPGTFVMGSPESELGRDNGDEFQHQVTLTQSFWMSPYEVTEELWDEVMGSGASVSQLPQGNVSWNDAIQFCNALSTLRGLTPAYTYLGSGQVTWDPAADGYRLPTEAEWEYACRAGSTTAFTNGEITEIGCDDPVLDLVARYCAYFSGEVGEFLPNEWGLFDMHGSVMEFCWDVYQQNLGSTSVTDPIIGGYEQNTSTARIMRGGAYFSEARNCRSAYRHAPLPNYAVNILGFRLARSAIEK